MIKKSLPFMPISSLHLILVAAVYFATVLNGGLWRFIWHFTEVADVKSLGLALAFLAVLLAVFVVTFSLVLVKYFTKPLLILLLSMMKF